VAERFTLFGSTASLEDVADACGRVLDRVPELHDSDYFGEYYRWDFGAGWEIDVKRNVADDGSPYEPDFEDWPVLVYESGATDPDSALKDVEILQPLRNEWL
jgi:hypothetical protein